MRAFLTGIVIATVLCGATYWVYEAATVTMAEKSENPSVILHEAQERTGKGVAG